MRSFADERLRTRTIDLIRNGWSVMEVFCHLNDGLLWPVVTYKQICRWWRAYQADDRPCRAPEAPWRKQPTLAEWIDTYQFDLPQWSLERWIDAEQKGLHYYPDGDDMFINWVRENVTNLDDLKDDQFREMLPDQYEASLPPQDQSRIDFDGPPRKRKRLSQVNYGATEERLKEYCRRYTAREQIVNWSSDAEIRFNEHLIPDHWKTRNLTQFKRVRKITMTQAIHNPQAVRTKIKGIDAVWAPIPDEHYTDLRNALQSCQIAVVSSQSAPDGEKVYVLSEAAWNAIRRK